VFSAVKNTTKIAISILQRSAATQNVLGGLINIHNLLPLISYSVRLPKFTENLLTYVKVNSEDEAGPFY